MAPAVRVNGRLYVGSHLFAGTEYLPALAARGDVVTIACEEKVGAMCHRRTRRVVLIEVQFQSELEQAKVKAVRAWRGPHGNRKPREGDPEPPVAPEPRVRPCYVDVKTGTLFSPKTGRCLSTPQLRLEIRGRSDEES